MEEQLFKWSRPHCKRFYIPLQSLRDLFGADWADEDAPKYLRFVVKGTTICVVRGDGFGPHDISCKRASHFSGGRVFDYCVKMTGLDPRGSQIAAAPIRFDGRRLFIDLEKAEMGVSRRAGGYQK